MESLMRLVVPELDGGLFRALFGAVSDNFANFSAADQSSFEFRLYDSDDLPSLTNLTYSNSVFLNSSYAVNNVSYVDMGKPLLAWYFHRLKSQTSLFIVAFLLWLMLLACLLFVYLHLRRLQSQQTRRIGYYAKDEKKLKPLFGLLTVIMLLLVIGCVMAILHWSGRARFSGMSEFGGNSSDSASSNSGSAPSRSHLTAAFRRVIDEFDDFVEQSIVETNATVLGLCQDELPNVLRVLETIATYLLDRLAVDFKLAPLLASFDDFIDLVKLLVDSMRAIKASRSEVVSPLAEFSTRIESVRTDLGRQVADACSDAGKSPAAPPGYLCASISNDLSKLAVGIDHKQLDSDSSVTIVTLLEKMLKLNFSQVEGQVDSAKGQLYGSLDLVKAEVRKLFDQLVVRVSDQFNRVLADAEQFRSGLRGAKKDRGFLIAMEAIDKAVLVLGVVLAVGSFAFLGILVLALFVSLRYLLSFRTTRRDSANGTPRSQHGGDEVDLVSLGTPQPNGATPRKSNGSSSNSHQQDAPLLDDDPIADVVLPSARQNSREPRDWHSTCLLMSCLLVLAALVYASVVFYAGAEAHMDACRYVTTPSGVAKIDGYINVLVEGKLWPQVESLLDREVNIPLGITKDIVPKRLIGPILDRCGNESTTIFQALELEQLLDVEQILRSRPVLAELNKGSDMIVNLVRDLDTSNLIPAEVDDLLQKTLPSFAAVIDAENFAPSILELNKPLLLIGSQLPSLLEDLAQLESSLRHRNSSDRRAVLIRYFADRTSSLIAEWNGTLTTALGRLLRHYNTLQNNRHLTNLTLRLTTDAMLLKVTLSNKNLLLGAIRSRFNETLTRHLATVANLLEGIVSRLMASVGRCQPLVNILRIPVGWCSRQIEPLPSTGLYMMVSCLAFYMLVHLLLVLMYLMKRETVAGPKVRR